MARREKQCFHSFISTTANGFLKCAQCGTVARLVDGKPVVQLVSRKKPGVRVVYKTTSIGGMGGTLTKSENDVLLGKRALVDFWKA